jgi:nitroreductase
MHAELADLAEGEPKRNDRYDIYHFYARDPEGRSIEFQAFEHPLEPHLDGEELLRTRRSIRDFTDQEVDEGLLTRVLDACAYAPSSRNAQPWYFVPVRERERLERLAAIRGESSEPIAAGPMAIAICTSPAESGRPIEDGCIAAYHLILAAWDHGLGTCWIGGLDRAEVKEILGIPQDHYVATVTPLGFPAAVPKMTPRRPIRRAP